MSKHNICYLEDCNKEFKKNGVFPFCSKKHKREWADENYNSETKKKRMTVPEMQKRALEMGKEVTIRRGELPF